ncbi:MAG TPA: hypothetical protein VHW00_17245 [Thermoanaerobaculia bacterium]|nr:hypothetical protein [Thermoanaerobaculia bacterium]
MRSGKAFLALAIIVLLPRAADAACPVERARVKSAADAQAAQIQSPAVPISLGTMHILPMIRPLPQDGRIAPDETTLYSVTATLIAYRLTPEGELHLVLSDDARRTVIAKLPSPNCIGGSRFASEIANARAEADWTLAPTDAFKEVRQAVEVQGVGFFDFLQGQRGAAPNGFSIHPVTAIDFTPPFNPKPPPLPVRRRAAGIIGKSCTNPSLSIAISKTSACAGEPLTVTWSSSDAGARVNIDGIGVGLPASGNRLLTASASAAFSGRATTSCGAGDEAVAVVNVTSASLASLTGPVAMATGDTTTLSVSVSGAPSWTLTSALGNPLSPNSGTSSRTVTYTATRSGSDTITLSTAGNGCGNSIRTISIVISAPPPTNSGLRCCDGTRSPTCFNCNDKRGCCSNHGGVCGCS